MIVLGKNKYRFCTLCSKIEIFSNTSDQDGLKGFNKNMNKYEHCQVSAVRGGMFSLRNKF